MSIVLALISALAYGVSDFLGGIFSRRASAWQVAVVGQSSSALFAALAGLFLVGAPTGHDWWWGALAGIGGGLGAAFLYRGFAYGRMGVVAPISAIGSALVPVAAGLVTGDRPQALAWAGIVFAFPAIYLISRSPEEALPGSHTGGIVDGVLAGLGFGTLFAFLGQVDPDAGIMPLALAQVTSVASVIVTATILRAPWVPRTRTPWAALMMGPLGAGATGCFLYATHHGLLSVVSVITALYPASTILLAAVVLREHIYRAQAVGLVLAGLAVSLVALD